MIDEARSTGLRRGDASSAGGWELLRDLVAEMAPQLSAPAIGLPGWCTVCRGPAAGRQSRCYQCELHVQCAPGGLADVVVPVAFAVKGASHARRLWQYKSSRAGADAAARAAVELLALLLIFLREHGSCACRAAGFARPTHLAVVPSTRGRPGQAPLRALVAPYLAVPWAELSGGLDRERTRDLDPARFRAAAVPGARVLLLDDTWTTGASAQSAAMALRAAGARSVATVVLGRHVGRQLAGFAAVTPARAPFRPGSCAVHAGRDVPGAP